MKPREEKLHKGAIRKDLIWLQLVQVVSMRWVVLRCKRPCISLSSTDSSFTPLCCQGYQAIWKILKTEAVNKYSSNYVIPKWWHLPPLRQPPPPIFNLFINNNETTTRPITAHYANPCGYQHMTTAVLLGFRSIAVSVNSYSKLLHWLHAYRYYGN